MEQSPTTLVITPFTSVESAWFSTIRDMQSAPIRALSEPARRRVDAVIKCLDTLYRNRRIEMLHVRIMRIWGARGVAPNPARQRENSDWRIWQEAMDRLDAALRAKGIVAGALFQDAAD